MTIRKKYWVENFVDILSGKKKFDLRLADFEVAEGDTIIFEEWDNDNKRYTGRKLEVIAKYVLKTQGLPWWSKEDAEKHGFQIIQFEINECLSHDWR